MSENTTLLRRAGVATAVAVLALPGAAFANGDSDSDSDRGHNKIVHVHKMCDNGSTIKWSKKCPPPPPVKPADPVTPPPSVVTVTGPATAPLIQVINNVGASGSGPAAGQITTPNPAAVAAGAAAATTSPNNVAVSAQSAASRSCVSKRRFRLHLGVIRRATVTLNGRSVRVVRNRRTSSYATIDLRSLPRGTYTVRFSAVKRNGRVTTGSRRYRTCA